MKTQLIPVITPEELRAAVEAAASQPTEIGFPASLAPVIDISTRQVIA